MGGIGYFRVSASFLLLTQCFDHFSPLQNNDFARTHRAPDTIRSGQLGGPIAFFDRHYQAVVLISPLNHFMITNQWTDIHGDGSTVLNYGLMGSIQVSRPNQKLKRKKTPSHTPLQRPYQKKTLKLNLLWLLVTPLMRLLVPGGVR